MPSRRQWSTHSRVMPAIVGAEREDQVVVLALAGRQDPEKCPILPEELVDLHVSLEGEVEEIGRVLGQAGVRAGRREERLAAREEGLDELLQRRLLALEVQVERALGDAARRAISSTFAPARPFSANTSSAARRSVILAFGSATRDIGAPL